MKTLFSGLCAIFLASRAFAGDYSQIHIFGDSLSDSGNLHIALLQQGAGGLPGEYSKTFQPIPLGRASNGPVTVEYVASGLGLQALPSFIGGSNYAFIGAKAQMDNDQFPFDLPAQVYTFAGRLQASGTGLTSSDLVTVMIGANDVRSAIETAVATRDIKQGEALVDAAIAATRQQLGVLRSLGARNWLLVNVPEMEDTPYMQGIIAKAGKSTKNVVKDLTRRFNSQFARLASELDLQGSGQVRFFDIYQEAHVIRAKAFSAGFTDRTNTCWSQTDGYINGCSATSINFFYFDDFHPSTRVHKLVGDRILDLLD